MSLNYEEQTMFRSRCDVSLIFFYIVEEMSSYVITILASDELVSSTLFKADKLNEEVTLCKKRANGSG